MRLISQVIITNDTDNTIRQLEALSQKERFIKIIKDDKFLVEDASLAIQKAYVASEETTIIILAGKSFSDVVQNKLLKVIEEPPNKKEFIIITPNKSTILPTIRSRLPITILSSQKEDSNLGLDLSSLSLATVYMFVQTHKRTDTKSMKAIIEDIGKEVIHSQNYNLDNKTLNLISNSFVALDLGSPPTFVLTTLLLKLLARKKR